MITGAAMGLGLAAAQEWTAQNAHLILAAQSHQAVGAARRVAKLVAFLLSRDCSYANGQTIAIDGGESNSYGIV